MRVSIFLLVGVVISSITAVVIVLLYNTFFAGYFGLPALGFFHIFIPLLVFLVFFKK